MASDSLKTDQTLSPTHPEASEFPLPSGATLYLQPLTGADYITYQGKVVNFTTGQAKPDPGAANQWLATKAFHVKFPKDDAAKALDIKTLMGNSLTFADMAALNGVLTSLLQPEELEQGRLPSGKTFERVDAAGNVFWQYQSRIGKAIAPGGGIGNPKLLAEANAWLAAQLFKAEGESLTFDAIAAMPFQDAAFLIGEAGNLLNGSPAL